jgi:hypothetical protein
MAKVSVNWFVKYTLKYVKNFCYLLNLKKKIVRNEILHVQCTTHNAVIQFYKLTVRFKSEHSP